MASTDGPGVLASDRQMVIPRLPFIEGVRGLAALVVFLGHAVRVDNSMWTNGSVFDASPRQLIGWLVWPGTEMVLLFLTVSAFSLAYSETVRRAKGNRPTGFRQFSLRRLWRVAPTYYVALALGAVAVLITPQWFTDQHEPFRAVGHVTLPGVVSHLVFLHDASRDWKFQLNGPLWSMACEVQLYLVFPLLFWAVRRWNPWAICLPVFVLSELASVVVGAEQLALAGFFALGLLVAEIYPRLSRRSAGWLAAVGGVALLVAMANVLRDQVAHDVVWAVAIVCLLLAMTRRPDSGANPCNARWLRWVGLRSYSLYALHLPVLMLVAYATRHVSGQPWVTLAVAVPVVALVVEAGYRLVERPATRRASAVRAPRRVTPQRA